MQSKFTAIIIGLILFGGLILLITKLDEPSLAELNAIQQKLAPECKFTDLGSYGSIEHVVMVRCDGKDVSATSSYDRHGKTSDHGLTVAIDG